MKKRVALLGLIITLMVGGAGLFYIYSRMLTKFETVRGLFQRDGEFCGTVDPGQSSTESDDVSGFWVRAGRKPTPEECRNQKLVCTKFHSVFDGKFCRSVTIRDGALVKITGRRVDTMTAIGRDTNANAFIVEDHSVEKP